MSSTRFIPKNIFFLRELISNASDALDKLKYWTLTNPDLQKPGEAYKITITPDKDHNTLTISDNGIGMNRDDLINHIGTIAKSGTAEFLQNTKDNASAVDLIGKFGVGFYSAFMVAAKVEITTRRVDSDKAYKWVSNGVDGFEISEAEKPETVRTSNCFSRTTPKTTPIRFTSGTSSIPTPSISTTRLC